MRTQATSPAILSDVDVVPREIAEAATAPAPRTFSEDEAYAIAADRIQRETASLQANIETLTTEKAALADQLDVTAAAKATAETERDDARRELAEYKAQIETEREVAARREERVAKVRETAAHLPDTFFTDERAQRWAAKSEEDFDAYVRELAELAPATGEPRKDGEPPRETAMHGNPVTPKDTNRGNAKSLLQLRRGA